MKLAKKLIMVSALLVVLVAPNAPVAFAGDDGRF